MWRQFDERLRDLLAEDSARVHRLAKAGTSGSFSCNGDAVTLLLDRHPPAVAGRADARVRVSLSPAAADRFTRGDLVLSTALLEGEAQATGPVRRYLAVDPVLRGLLRRRPA